MLTQILKHTCGACGVCVCVFVVCVLEYRGVDLFVTHPHPLIKVSCLFSLQQNLTTFTKLDIYKTHL